MYIENCRLTDIAGKVRRNEVSGMIHVIYACDGAYVRQTLISMMSLAQSNPDAEITLVRDDVPEESYQMMQEQLQPYGVRMRSLDIREVLPGEVHNPDIKDRHPHTIYAKLFLDETVDAERILYLDSDVIIRDSLEGLFQRDMSHECVAGVLMPYSSRLKERIGAFPGEPYICDGVVLINLLKWRQERCSSACLEYIRSHQGQPPMLSEGTLNHVCRGQIGVLEPRYNLMPSMMEYDDKEIRQLFRADCYYKGAELLREAKDNPAIIHFMNELYDRPWCTGCTHPLKDRYLEIEREIYGENQLEESSISGHTKMTMAMRKMLPFGVFSALYHLKNQV